jgi:hypothetical protein
MPVEKLQVEPELSKTILMMNISSNAFMNYIVYSVITFQVAIPILMAQ